LDSQRKTVASEPMNQVFQILDGRFVWPEAGRKLSQQHAQLARLGQWSDALSEDIEVLLGDKRLLSGGRLVHLGVSELLPQLDGKAEVLRHLACPRFGGVLVRRAIERAVDLDGVEVLGVEAQFVFVLQLGWVKRALPRALALGIAPARGADIEKRRCAT